MAINYYPWNAQVLVTWLKQELVKHQTAQALAAQLEISPWELQAWLTSPMPTINLAQIWGIARYRNWSLQETCRWLRLQPAHVEALIAQKS